MPRIRYHILLLIAFAFVVSGQRTTSAYVVASEYTHPKLDTALEKSLVAHEFGTVQVIVQAVDDLVLVEAQIAQLGGKVSQTLPIIQGVAAEMPITAVLALAELPTVKLISLDGMVQSSAQPVPSHSPTAIAQDGEKQETALVASCQKKKGANLRDRKAAQCVEAELLPEEANKHQKSSAGTTTVLDRFSSTSLSNNDGTANWSGSWVETGESSQSFYYGDIQVRYDLGGNRLRVRDDNNSVYRLADLSGASNATLSYKYSRVSLDSSSEYVAVEISSNGGASWTELARYQGPGTDPVYYDASFDISAYASSQTAVRFRSPSGYMSNGDMVFFDDVEISFADGGNPPPPPTGSNEGLVAAYGFEEGEGIQVADLSGNGNAGLQVGAVWEDNGYSGTAVSFDGVNDYISIPDSTSLDVTGELTIEAWVRPDVISSGKWHPIAYKENFNYPVNYGFSIVGDEIIFGFYANGWHDTVTSGVNLQANTWVHVAIVYDDAANSTKIYVNGTLVRSKYESGSLQVNNEPVRIGLNPLHAYFDGRIDELRIYERALTASEIQADMVTPVGSSQSNGTPSATPGDYLSVMGVDQVLNQGIDGSGVTIAVVDSGIKQNVLGKILKAIFSVIGGAGNDEHGHGTFMAGILSNVSTQNGEPVSVAPGADIIDVRVLDSDGKGNYSDVIQGLNWILANQTTHDIRVVNLSIMGPVTGPYWENPLNQAVEALWDAGIVVVAAAGNTGPKAGSITTPGNDPFVITVGAFTDNYTPANTTDDYIPPFSGSGPTEAGFVKPDVIAPGAHILMKLDSNTTYAQTHPNLHKGNNYYQGSGTSAATAATSGVVALMLQQNPNLTPNQVKYRLMASAKTVVTPSGDLAYSILQQGAGKVWAPDAVFGSYSGSSNSGMIAGEDYVGPVIYDSNLQGYRLVDQNRNPLPPGQDYFWDGKFYWDSGNFWGGNVWSGGNFWGGGNVWSGGNFWGGSYFTNSSYYWNSNEYWNGNNYWSGNHYWDGLTPEQP